MDEGPVGLTRAAPGPAGLIPIVLGVTGHRDLHPDCVEKVRLAVRGFLSRTRAQFPNSPLWLLSGLAEGADSLVAQEFLEKADLGERELVAVLPFPKVEFEKDFKEPGALKGFRTLLGCAAHTVVVSPQIPIDGAARAVAYERVGAYLVQHSNVFLALWNLRPSEKRGGTFQVVQFRRTGLPRSLDPGRSVLEPPETASTHVVGTRRKSDDDETSNSADQCGWYGPGARDGRPMLTAEQGDPLSEIRLARIDAYNRRARQVILGHEGELAKAERRLLRGVELESLPDGVLPLRAMRAFAVATTLARQLRDRINRSYKVLLGIYLLAMLALQIYGGPWMWVGMMMAYLGLFAVIEFLARWNSRQETDFFDARGLAEGLRVLFYWRLAGLGTSVADNHLAGQKDEVGWIRQALRSVESRCESQEACEGGSALAAKHWVEEQTRYFNGGGRQVGAAAERERKARLARVLMLVVRWMGIAAAATTIVLTFAADSCGDGPLQWLLVVSGMALLGASVLDNYSTSMAWSEEAKRYTTMGIFFERAGRTLAELEKDRRPEDEVRSVLLEVGLEALNESSNWVLMHRERPLTVKIES